MIELDFLLNSTYLYLSGTKRTSISTVLFYMFKIKQRKLTNRESHLPSFKLVNFTSCVREIAFCGNPAHHLTSFENLTK